jgi:hypothetical protein
VAAATARHRVRLPGFLIDEQVGLGTVIKRSTSYIAMKPCGGCQRRADMLNRWMIFSPWRGR